MSIFSVAFVKDAGERALKTLAQSLLAILAVGAPIWDIDWTQGLGIALTATAFSVLTSLASHGIGDGSASAVSASPGGRHRLEE